MAKPNPNILLVEGDDDRRVIPFFMDEYVVWGNKEAEWVAEIRSHGGIEDLLDPSNIEAAAMPTGCKALGIVVELMISSIHDGLECGTAASESPPTFQRISPQRASSIKDPMMVFGSASGSCPTINRGACWKPS
jgi:hypothetical protein